MGKESLAVEVTSLRKTFGRREVLKDIDLKLPAGEFLTIFGPNGAGKTTLLKILSTLLTPTAGDVFVSGLEVKSEPTAVRKIIGLLSHSPLLYLDLTAYENLAFYGRMYGVVGLDERIDELLGKVELSHRRFDRVGTFSRGMIQRLAIARALLHRPEIVFLDEPYAGLDPHAAGVLDSILEELRADHTFVMVTHDTAKGFSLASRLMVLSQGEMVLSGPKAQTDLASFQKAYAERVTGER